MNREELRKLIQGPIAAVPTPFDDDFKVDYGRMADLTEWWVENGLVKGKAVIKVAAAMGEGPQLSDSEWPHLLRTVVQAANDKAAIVCGIHYKDTKRVTEDAKKAQDLGAIGLQVSPPIFHGLSQDDMLWYYNNLSDVIDIGILIYNTHWMSGGAIYAETFHKMVDFGQVAAIKWSPSEGDEYEDIFKSAHIFNVIDNTGQPILNHKLGGRGYVQTTLFAHPPHDLKVWELMEKGQYDKAEELYYRVQAPLRTFGEKISKRSGGQARTNKGVMAIMGRPIGTSRPPSKPLNDEEMMELRQIVDGFGWPVP